MDITELNRAWNQDNLQRHPWEITRARVITFLLKKHKKKIAHITDIGSGDGYVLQTLVHQKVAGGYSAIDTAFTTGIIEKLKQSMGENAVDFFLNVEQARNKKIVSDCILLTDVLEHCANDKEVLHSIIDKNVLINNGLLLITVPAYQQIFSQHDYLLKHYRRYTRKQIIKICQSQRLKVEASGYFFFSLLPVRIFQLSLQRMGIFKTKKSIDNWKGNSFVTKFISFILWLDFRVCYALSGIGIHLPGLSCYCVCKKVPS